jgi:membrane protein
MRVAARHAPKLGRGGWDADSATILPFTAIRRNGKSVPDRTIFAGVCFVFLRHPSAFTLGLAVSFWLTKRFWPRLWSAMTKWQEDDGLTWAASLAYYAALSFFPLVMLLISGLGFVLEFSHTAKIKQDEVLAFLGDRFSPSLSSLAGEVLGEVKSSALISGPIGFVTLLFAAIGIFIQLEAAFDRIWKSNGSGQKRSLWRLILNVLLQRLRAFLFLLAVGVLVLVAFIGNMVVTGITRYAEGLPLGASVVHLLQLAVGGFLNGLMFTLVYKVLPKKPVAWKQAIGGGLVAGVAWEIGRQLLAHFLIGRSYTAYGVVGSFIVMMLWFYYASMVLLFGAEYVEAGSRKEPINAAKS